MDALSDCLIVLHPDDARDLLGLAPGMASDLAVDVFHDDEAGALRTELAAAFPWPVRIETRDEARSAYRTETARRGSLLLFLCVPSALALVFLLVVTVRSTRSRSYEAGLLKALGWTVSDVVSLELWRALSLGLPAVALGAGAACLCVFLPGITWPGFLFFGWRSGGPALWLSPAGAGMVLAELAACVLVPYAVAVLWPALRAASRDPETSLREEALR